MPQPAPDFWKCIGGEFIETVDVPLTGETQIWVTGVDCTQQPLFPPGFQASRPSRYQSQSRVSPPDWSSPS